jgi:hypothetical protein
MHEVELQTVKDRHRVPPSVRLRFFGAKPALRFISGGET